MPYDGSGNFIRNFPPGGWQGDATANIKIKSDRHDQHDNDLASGLSNALCKDGQSSPTADIPMNGKKIVNLGAPVNPNDAATKAYADTSKPSTTGLVISGADALGRLTFTSPTGTNGLAFTGADLSWVARLATAAGPGEPPVPPATLNRMALNDKPDGLGTDVATFNDNGSASITGAFTASTIAATGSVTGSIVYAGGAYLGSDGNITGSIWLNLGYNDAYSAITTHIETRAITWANDRVANLQYRRVSEGLVGSVTVNGPHRCPAGTVATGLQSGSNDTVSGIYYHYLQVYDPVRGWVGFQG